jgi:type VI secretion system protein ImpA
MLQDNNNNRWSGSHPRERAMAIIEAEQFLRPVSDESPAGDNLEYDPAYGELERAARGKEERESAGKKLEAEPPKWRDVADAATELLGRTRDLRIAVYLTHSALNLEGLAGLGAGLKLIHGLLDQFWDTVHPQLDKEDNDDPTLRVNSLSPLDARAGLLQTLSRVPLVESQKAGRFSLRDLRMASGEAKPVGGEKAPDSALIEAAFMDCSIEGLTATDSAITEAIATVDAIKALLAERVGVERAASFENLGSDLRAMQFELAPRLQRRGVSEAGAAAAAPGTAVAAGAVATGEIRSRDDAVRTLDNLVDYFRRNEPSSPVPLLLQRAKRLVAKDFMEILRDLTPDGVSQAELIGGLPREE